MSGGQNLVPQTHAQAAGCAVLSFFKLHRYLVLLHFRVIPLVPQSFDLDKVMCRRGPYFSWCSGEESVEDAECVFTILSSNVSGFSFLLLSVPGSAAISQHSWEAQLLGEAGCGVTGMRCPRTN